MNIVEHEITLDGRWKVGFFKRFSNGDDKFFVVEFRLTRRDGNGWNLEIRGQVKKDGCSDWGFGDRVMLHGCGWWDMMVFGWVYDLAMALHGRTKGSEE